jgi:hypothetical protein
VPSLLKTSSNKNKTFGANGRLTAELFENAGVVVGDPPVVTPAAPFGQNVRSKSYFESAISTEWRKNVASIVQTGALLLEAEEELDRQVFHALKTPFTARVSQMLRRIARHPILRDKTYHGSLPACWRTLYALAELDDHALLRAALADGRIHSGLQRKDIRDALGLPPKPPRGARKGDGQTEVPLDPVAVWKAFSAADKRAILNSEGRSGLAKLLSRELMVDLVDHSIRQEMVGSSTKLKPAVGLTSILRATLDPAIDSGVVFERFKAKLKSLGLDLHDVSIALKGQGRGKR